MKEQYLHNKRRVLRMYSSVLSDMRVDRNDKKISSSNLENIWEWIANFSEEFEKLQKEFINIDRENDREGFLMQEGEELLSLSIEFGQTLKQWLEFHKKELSWLSWKLGSIANSTHNESLEAWLLQHQWIIHTQINKIRAIL